MNKLTYFLFTKSLGLFVNFLWLFSPKRAVDMAYFLFSKPREGRFTNENMPSVLKSTLKETLVHKDQKCQTYIWKGNDTVVLLVHGWESNASRWENLLPFLKKSGSTIIALDAPAHGLSDGINFNIPEYAEFIHVLAQKYNPEYLIGHSMGGKACLYYQATYQFQSVKKIVSLGAPCDFKIIVQNYINLLSLNSKVAEGLYTYYLEHFNLKIDEFSSTVYASKIIVKGLIVHDKGDTTVLPEEGKKIAQAWKDSVFIETKGLGHGLHGVELYKEMTEFLFKDSESQK
ncbi:MAG: alpha/beta fold hydrolase [Flavobacterium sp.]